MKKVGVIGGMGPKATIDFLDKLISLTPAKKDQEHLNMVIYMNPQVPDRTEAIIANQESPEPALIESAQLLKHAGAHFIVIPCVTAHVWLPAIRNSVSIPVLSMVELSLKKVKQKKLNNIGLLATTGTLWSKLFEGVFKKENIEIIIPDDETQENYLMKSIYRIKKGAAPHQVKPLILQACKHLIERSAQAIIAACTEISLAIDKEDVAIPLIDVNEILAEETIRLAFYTD